MPALDALSKDPGPDVDQVQARGTARPSAAAARRARPTSSRTCRRSGCPSNFRLCFTNDSPFDTVLAKVNKIEALTVKQKVVENAIGELRDYQQEPARSSSRTW